MAKNSNKFDIARRFFKLYSSILALLKLKFYGFEIGFEVGFKIGSEIGFEIGSAPSDLKRRTGAHRKEKYYFLLHIWLSRI